MIIFGRVFFVYIYIILSFFSSLLIVIAGIILLYIAIMDEEIETELAFN